MPLHTLLIALLFVRCAAACPTGATGVPASQFEGELTVTPTVSVCLNMIVKNEAHVISRALDSASGRFDRWVIVDTGSTDDTMQVVRRRMRANDVLTTAEWKDFGTNREHALQVARDNYCEFVFFLDADDTVEFDPDFEWPSPSALRAVAWASVDVHYGTLRYERKALVDTKANCHWHDVLHEYMACVTPTGQLEPNFIRLEGVRIRVRSGGARSRDPDKYLKDAALLEAELAKNPEHSRYAFYLAQSYRDAGRPEQALRAYERRAAMPTGFAHETYEALLEVGLLRVKLKHDRSDVDTAFQSAYTFDKTRWETLYYWADYYRTQQPVPNYVMCFALTKLAAIRDHVELPAGLFVRQWIYDYGLADVASVCAYYARHIEPSCFNALRAVRGAERSHAETSTIARLRSNVEFIGQHTESCR